MLGEWSAAVCAAAAQQLSAAQPAVRLDADVAPELARIVEQRLRYVLLEARKRTWARRGDELSAGDINAALEAAGDERCLGHPRREAVRVAGAAGVASLEPVEVSVKQLLASEQKTRPPVEPSLALSWLAVEGEGCATATSESTDEATTAVLDGVASGALDREHELYVRKVVSAIRADGTGGAEARDVFRSLRFDAGLQRVVPYLVRFVVDEAAKAKKRPVASLSRCVAAVMALTANARAHIDVHLHELVPAALTCVVAKKLGSEGGDAHWALRRAAAGCVAGLVDRFGDRYENLRPRVTKTFADALGDDTKPLATRYGAIIGLAALGPLAVRSLVVPRVAEWASSLEARAAAHPADAADARKCVEALVDAAALYLRAEVSPARPSPALPRGAPGRSARRHAPAAEPPAKRRRFAPAEQAARRTHARLPGTHARLPVDVQETFGEALVPFTSGSPADIFI
ncbi:hypothetical protein M885DRAFT_588595 [Pelagophyceae sp. CCMP2097]|nr:hypothetical protein M885DRAFT_588595 [Pelagophyceae sp. CCMP2097]